MGKSILSSKTIWSNLVGIGTTVIAVKTGYMLSPEEVGGIFALANIVLRFFTNKPIVLPKL